MSVGASRPFDLVLFDFDGTLADSLPVFLEVFGDVVDRYGLRRPDAAEVEALRGMSTREVMGWLGVSPLAVPRMMRFARARMTERAREVVLFEGMGPMLDALAARGVPLGIVTSNAEGTVRAVLGSARSAHIRAWRCGVGLFGKASRIRGVTRALRVAPARAALVGDEPRDLAAARAAGVHAIAVRWGYGTGPALAAADTVCDDVRTLARTLGGE